MVCHNKGMENDMYEDENFEVEHIASVIKDASVGILNDNYLNGRAYALPISGDTLASHK